MTRCSRGPSGRLRSCFFIILFGAATLAANPAFAQRVAGRVTDPDGRPVASARILVVAGTSVITSTRTDRDGRYGPIDLPAGTYDIVAAAPGLHGVPRAVTVADALVDVSLGLTVAAVDESVVVSAAQVDAPLSRVTDSVTVIDRAELDARQTETVADALRLVPGFAVVGSGGRGAITSIFPRGGESDYTLVLADGVPLNTFGGGFDAAHLATADLDRVEVVRGPQSALYGSGAVGGVVQLITRHGGPASGRGLFEAGGNGTRRTLASGAGRTGALSWSGAAEYFSSDGDGRDYPAYGGAITNDDYERWDISAGAGWSSSATRRLRVDVRHGRNERGFPGPYGSDPAGLYGGIDAGSRGENDMTSVAVSGHVGSVLGVRHSGRVTWLDTNGHFTSVFGDFVSESDNDTGRLTGRYQADIERSAIGISAGLEWLGEQNDSTYITGGTFEPIPVERSNTGLFVETRLARGGRLSASAGLRLERIARRALDADPGAFNNRPAFDEDVIWSANPKISATWFMVAPTAAAPGRWTKLRAGAGTGIKAPTGFEIAFTDNPSLKPERSRSVDVGIEQALANATLLVDATFFANRYDDLIVTVGSALAGASRYRSDNIANAKAQGVELGATWRSPRGVRVRGAVTFLDTEVLAIDNLPGRAQEPFAVGDRLLRRAPRQGSVEVHWTAARGSAFLLINGRSEMLDLEPNFASSLHDNPGHTVVALGGALRLARAVELHGRVANLFDRDYEDVFGYPAPGRVAFVGLRIAAGR